MIEPVVGHFAVIEPRVAHASLAHNGVFRRPRVTAMQHRSDHGVLFIGNILICGLSDVVVHRKIRPRRNVIPRHKIKARNVDLHVVVPQAALIPRRIVRRAFDHRSAGRHGHFISKDASRAINCGKIS